MTIGLRSVVAALAAALTLSACGGSDDLFLLPEAVQASDRQRVGARSIEVLDVVLPAYAADVDILIQEPDGALRPVSGALWASDPQLGITQAISSRLDLGTTATAAPEPWPLFDDPDRSLQVTVERLVAVAGGQLEFSGQFAILSPTGAAREYLRRFDIRQPLNGTDPQSVASAVGRALDVLASQVADSL